MKLTDEERKELKELYESYKNVKDLESLRLLGGLIRTSKWYKNHKLTLKHVAACIWSLYYPGYTDYYTLLSLKEILNTKCNYLTRMNTVVIIEFLETLIECKSYTLYKPV